MLSKTLALTRYLIPRSACVEGPKVAEYERAFASRIGAKHAVAFMKGRFAFYGALKAHGIGLGDEVIMPGYTCAVVPAAVVNLGATPVYVDIEPTYCTAPLEHFEQALTPNTKAIMVQHTYGWPNVDLGAIVDFANKNNLAVFEDCCHSLGTTYQGRHVGNWGLGGFFSTQWSKPFTTGLGGVLACNDDAFYQKLIQVRDQFAHFPSPKLATQLAVQNIIYDMAVYPATMGLARQTYRKLTRLKIVTGSTNSAEYQAWDEKQFLRMSEVQAAAGLVDLQRLDEVMAHRKRLNEYYRSAVREAGYFVPDTPADSDVSLLRFPVRVVDKNAALAEAGKRYLEMGDWFLQPLHSNMLPYETLGYTKGSCPHAEKAAREMINLPTHDRVSESHARKLVQLLQEQCQPAAI